MSDVDQRVPEVAGDLDGQAGESLSGGVTRTERETALDGA